MDEKRKEGCQILYRDDKISVIGETFKLEGSLPSTELMKLYSTGKGRAVITLTVKVNEPSKSEETKKIKINALIDELANKGLTEEQIMNTEVTV